MKADDHLVDINGEETPYRVEELLEVGQKRQIAAAHDEKRDRSVVLRVILYDKDITDEEIAAERSALQREWQFLEDLGAHTLSPEPFDWLELPDSPIDKPPEPVIVCERIDGPNLYEWITESFTEGIGPHLTLRIMSELADFLALVHQKKWLWRDFDPRRFVMTEDGIRAVSIGHVVKIGERLDASQLQINPAYVAPEIRDELTGKMQRPSADMYGVGALMSFLLTGEEPRDRVESPLTFTAFEGIQKWELPGLELLVARLLQPLAKNRIGRAEILRKFCTVDTLPAREDRGFEMTMLPAPWLGLEMENPEENRALRSKLSAGPLVSVGPEGAAETDGGRDIEERRALNWPVIIGLIIFVAAALLFAIFSGP